MQAKREEQLLEHQHARDAAAARRHQEEAEAAATAAAHIQAGMEARDTPLLADPCLHMCASIGSITHGRAAGSIAPRTSGGTSTVQV